MRSFALVAAISAALIPCASAQRMISAVPAHSVGASRPAAPAFSGIRGSFANHHEGRPFSRFPNGFPFGWAYPFFADAIDSGDPYSTGYPVSSQLPFVVMQGGGPAMADTGERQAPSESLLIELQGDRYVRISGQSEDNIQQLSGNQDREQAARPTHKQSTAAAAVQPATPAPPLPPVVLILRDGTHQEVRDYTIADGILYARGDFYTDGYWNKTIQISSLDVPETLSANRAQGVSFVLPSAPNEVITRP
jgi:hypothetical protein